MVTSIARQSVIIKCSMQKSILTGNYEFYYAAGLAARLAGISVPAEASPQELAGELAEHLKDWTPQDDKEEYLRGMLSDYQPVEEYDGQMKELLQWGMEEQKLWVTVI